MTIDNVTSIHKSKIDPITVETLQEMLDVAKKGELQSIMYVYKNSGGEIGYGWGGMPDDAMIGNLEELKFTYFCATKESD